VIYAQPSSTYDAVFYGFVTGLVGTCGFRVEDASGAVIVARQTTGIVESPAGTGVYICAGTSPANGGAYFVIFDNGASPLTPSDVAVEELTVNPLGAAPAGAGGTDYLTLAELKNYMGVTDTTWDSKAPTLITAASEALNDYLQRQVTPKDDGPTTRRFQVVGYEIDLAPYDLRAVTTATLHPESSSAIVLVAETDYTLLPVPPEDGVYEALRISNYQVLISAHLFKYGKCFLDVVGSWGFATVPNGLKHACAEAVKSWLLGSFGHAGGPGYMNEDPRDYAPMPVAIGDLPLAAIRLANRWRRASGAV
jgi:hypothetical protein